MANQVRSLLQKLRAHNRLVYNDGRRTELPAFTSLGGYTLVYYDRDCSTLCAECATAALNDNIGTPDRDNREIPVDYGTYDEGPTLFCDGCNAELESSYGDPEEPDEIRAAREEWEEAGRPMAEDAHLEAAYEDGVSGSE